MSMTRDASPLSTALAHILETWTPSQHFITSIELARHGEKLTFVFRPTAQTHEVKKDLAISFSEKLTEIQRKHRSGEISLMEYLQSSSDIWDAAREDDVEIELGVVRGDVID